MHIPAKARRKLEDLVSVLRDDWNTFEENRNAENYATFHEHAEEVFDHADSVIAYLEDIFDGKSETWQESENGEAFSALLDAWRSFREEELTEPDAVDLVETDHLSFVDLAEDLPTETEAV